MSCFNNTYIEDPNYLREGLTYYNMFKNESVILDSKEKILWNHSI